MSKMKWTPGPWEAGGQDELDKYFPHVFIGPEMPWGENQGGESYRDQIVINCGPTPAMVRGERPPGGTTMETAWANACLIAKAPELYEMVRRMIPICEPHSIAQQAKALLAKARGEV